MGSRRSNGTSLKRRIRNGSTVLGLHVPMDFQRDQLEASLDRGPYEFVWVDSQHNPLNEVGLVSFCEMANDVGVDVVFRIKHTRHTYLVGNYLDLGPSGIEVPQVESEETADEAVSNFYYAPAGKRSWGGAKRLGFDEKEDRLEYARWWGEAGVLWLQLESVEAVTSARKLAKPGVDCLSFGPMDLTFSLESQPEHRLKTVEDCLRHVVEQLRGTDVAVCFRSYGPPDLRQKYSDMGVTVLLEKYA